MLESWSTNDRLLLAAALATSILAAGLIVRGVLSALGRTERYSHLHALVPRCRPPFWAFLLALTYTATISTIPEGELRESLYVLARLALISTGAWLAVRVAFAAEELAYRRHDVTVPDNRWARKKRTQAHVVRRVAILTTVLVAVGGLLAAFTSAKTLTTILVSAGVAGVIVGLSAQNTLTNMVAGIQIAFTDLLRIDDVVVVEEEWGKVEEITLTYVVIRIWDERTLVLPTSYFVSKPFQNWTRTESQVIGSIEISTDHHINVQALREELTAYLPTHPLWDRRVNVLQMTGHTPAGTTLRALVSSRDAHQNWDLRCDVREHLNNHLRDTQPAALPRIRIQERTDPPPKPSIPEPGEIRTPDLEHSSRARARRSRTRQARTRSKEEA